MICLTMVFQMLPQSWPSWERLRHWCQRGGSPRTGNSSRSAAWVENNSDRTKEFDATPSNDMKNGSSSNRNKARDGQDCGKHKASVRVLAVLGFCLRFETGEKWDLFQRSKLENLLFVPGGVLGVVGEEEVDGGGDHRGHQGRRDEPPHDLPVRSGAYA